MASYRRGTRRRSPVGASRAWKGRVRSGGRGLGLANKQDGFGVLFVLVDISTEDG